MELMVVLAVLLAFATIVTPSMMRLYADHQLKSAVEDVCVKLASCRVQAIDTGLIYQFRFEPDGQRYVVLPYELEEEAAGDQAAPQEIEPRRFSGQIPEKMTFHSASEYAAPAERLTEEWLTGLPDAATLADAAWSPPLLFFADGTAMDAAFEIADQKQQFVRLSVRGVTGAVKTSATARRSSR